MKILTWLILTFAFVNLTHAQSTTEEELVKKAYLDYLDGFYQGDTTKIINSISPTLHKFGYWKGPEFRVLGSIQLSGNFGIVASASGVSGRNCISSKSFPC